ncbi:MAG: hypothetical protein J5441_04305 [Clostridia bacterium]|nr:hypothetical protein [Clostridia bacterium]
MKRALSILIFIAIVISVCAVAPFTAGAAQTIKIACVGDSITYGYGLTSEMSYPFKLGTYLGSNYEVTNFGEGSATMLSDGKKPYIGLDIYQQSLQYDCDIVVIMLGTNDGKEFNWEGSNPKINKFKSELSDLIDTYRALPTHPTVYVMTSPTVFENGSYGIVPARVAEISGLQKEVAAEKGCPVIDMHSLTADQKDKFRDDYVHPLESGYDFIAQKVAEHIRAYPGRAPGVPHDLGVRDGAKSTIVSWEMTDKGDLPAISFNIYVNGELAATSSGQVARIGKLVNGQEYEIRVSAVNAAGESPLSEPVLAHPTAADPKVTGVEDGAVYDLADGAPSASWKNATSATLDGVEYVKGTEIVSVGEHELVVVNDNVVVTVRFTIVNSAFSAGDVDCDGEVTVADALSVLRVAARLAPETPEVLRIADMDGDGFITVSDALRVLRIAAKLA